MREILFRGKRVDNGEWVEGDFYHRIVHIDTFHQNTVVSAIEVFDGKNPLSIAYYTVDPETVGQYTGLKDKNGKRIFEGDVLSLRTGRPHVVKFEEGSFVLTDTAISIRYACKFEIIGNIHDNPELLED